MVPSEERIFAIDRPHPRLLKLYMIRAVLTGPGLVVLIPLLYFRYETMRFKFDAEGIHMSWGILFRKQVNLTYARIQDIHLTSNLIERWLRLARIQIQTASASASAEMTLEGLHEFEMVRDFLYSKMRGVRSGATAPVPENDLAAALREVTNELRAVREALEKRG